MGMYTGLRFKGYIKVEYRDMIDSIVNGSDEWEEYSSEYTFLDRFMECSRRNMIPFGSLSYMPDSWEDNTVQTEGFKLQFDPATGYWSFQCSLKNYSDEINVFLNDVIAIIAEKTEHIEVLYEEWNNSILYKLEDGEIVKCGHIGYGYDDDTFHWVQVIE
jgi:hypothetical protein